MPRGSTSRWIPQARMTITSGSRPTPARQGGRTPGHRSCDLRARQVQEEDFERFDLILAMDRHNHATLLDRSPPEYHARIRTLLEFAGETAPADVPDPYYGGAKGFDDVLDLVQSAADGLLGEIRPDARPLKCLKNAFAARLRGLMRQGERAVYKARLSASAKSRNHYRIPGRGNEFSRASDAGDSAAAVLFDTSRRSSARAR